MTPGNQTLVLNDKRFDNFLKVVKSLLPG